MIEQSKYSNEIMKKEEFRLGTPTNNLEKFFSQISPISSNRNLIYNTIEKTKGNYSFYESSEKKGYVEFSDTKQETSSEETKVIANNSLNSKEQANIDQDERSINKRIIIDTEKYKIVCDKAQSAEAENEPIEEMEIDSLILGEDNRKSSVQEEASKVPRRSTRIIKLNEQKEINKKDTSKPNKKPVPQKEEKSDVKKETKKESRRITRSKVKTVRSKKTMNTRDTRKSNKKAKNATKSKSKDYSDESSIEVISTNLDLNESFSDKKEKAKIRKSPEKKRKIILSSSKSNDSNANLAHLTNAFDNFIKFCQNRFDLLESKIGKNAKAVNPNPSNRNNANKGGNKKISLDEKFDLKNKILNLNREQLMELSKIIKSNAKNSNQTKLEVDLMKIPEKTLKQIKKYVNSCLIREKDDFMKDTNKLASETEKKLNGNNAAIPNKEAFNEDRNLEKMNNCLLGKKRNKCILEDSQDLSESLSSSSSDCFSL